MEGDPNSYVLIHINQFELKNKKRNLMRYLKNHGLEGHYLRTPESVVEHLCETLMESSESTPLEPSSANALNSAPYELEVRVMSNQELLEKWAKERFNEGSDEMKLLFGPLLEEDQFIIDDHEPIEADKQCENQIQEKTINDEMLNLFNNDDNIGYMHSDSDDDDTLKTASAKNVHTQQCGICKVIIDVGKTRLTKLRRQTEHAMIHHAPSFADFTIHRRYRCMSCTRVIPVHKPPGDHIDDYHYADKSSVTICDLWNQNQLNVFNNILARCFDRCLPIPRGRKTTNESGEVNQKTPYCIKMNEEMMADGGKYSFMAMKSPHSMANISEDEEDEDDNIGRRFGSMMDYYDVSFRSCF